MCLLLYQLTGDVTIYLGRYLPRQAGQGDLPAAPLTCLSAGLNYLGQHKRTVSFLLLCFQQLGTLLIPLRQGISKSGCQESKR